MYKHHKFIDINGLSDRERLELLRDLVVDPILVHRPKEIDEEAWLDNIWDVTGYPILTFKVKNSFKLPAKSIQKILGENIKVVYSVLRGSHVYVRFNNIRDKNFSVSIEAQVNKYRSHMTWTISKTQFEEIFSHLELVEKC